MNNIKYPIFMFTKRWAWKVNQGSDTKEVSEKYCKQLYREIKIIDSNLNLFVIDSIHILNKAGLLGYKLGYKGKFFNIKESYRLVKTLDYVEVKKTIGDIIADNNEIYDSGLVIKELIADINKTSSFRELIDLLPTSK